MKKVLSIISIALISAFSFGANLVVNWTNDAGNPLGTQTVVSYGISPGVYTNSITVAYGVTSVTLTNLNAGIRYYVAARATDGVDFSSYSNEDNGKTKLNTPKNLAVTP